MNKSLAWTCFCLKVLLYVLLLDAVILTVIVLMTDLEPFRYVGF